MYTPFTLLALSLAFASTNVLAAPAKAAAATGAGAAGAGAGAAGAAGTAGTAGCADMIIVFARGTTESDPVGSIVGPPLEKSVKTAMAGKSVKMMGVTSPAYPADVAGFNAGGSAPGSKMMATMATDQFDKCPNSTIVISGYSQGGQLVHNAAKMIPPEKSAKMKALIFGDPDNGDAVQGVPKNSTLVVCHTTDNICAHGKTILPAHLSYGGDTDTAAKFLAGKAKAA